MPKKSGRDLIGEQLKAVVYQYRNRNGIWLYNNEIYLQRSGTAYIYVIHYDKVLVSFSDTVLYDNVNFSPIDFETTEEFFQMQTAYDYFDLTFEEIKKIKYIFKTIYENI